jgi:hypothetical protein
MANLSGRVGVTRDAWLRSVALGAPGRNGAFNDRPEPSLDLVGEGRRGCGLLACPPQVSFGGCGEGFAGDHEAIVSDWAWPVKRFELAHLPSCA